MKTIIIFLLIFLLVGCNNKGYYKDRLEKTLNIKITNNFKVIDYESGFSSTSDFNESFGLKFSKKEFVKLFNIVNPKKAVSDSSLYYYEIVHDGKFIELTFEPSKLIIYYSFIEE
jgi:hypothetical protein